MSFLCKYRHPPTFLSVFYSSTMKTQPRGRRLCVSTLSRLNLGCHYSGNLPAERCFIKNGDPMIIKLPKPNSINSVSLETALRQRATKREYLDNELSLSDLSKLLFSGQGLRGDHNKLLAPSAQEQYPLSTFIVVKRVTDIEKGLYLYENSDHSLVKQENGDFSELLENAALGEQPWIHKAAAVIVLAGNINSMNQHFSTQPPLNKRGERYNYIEVGAVAQNIQLQGTVLNIGMVLVGGFDNERVKSILKLPPELEPSALLCLGNV